MDSYDRLIDGYHIFQQEYQQDTNWRDRAKDQQHPEVMVVACSDSRVNPAILTGAGLGEIFMANNVANLVPPYKASGNSRHSTSTAIEYAVTHLRVKHIIIMGHSTCGGIHALLANHGDSTPAPDAHYSFIGPWIKIVDKAADFTPTEKAAMTQDEMAAICGRRACVISLNNLQTFPWIQDAMQKNTLQVHGWYFDIASGILTEYNPDTEQFEEFVMKNSS